MEQNREIQLAWDFVEHTAQSIFLTGKAGTGKTTFLKTVKQRSSKRMVVVAPTGVAAINAGGVTIHSFFQLPLSPFVPNTVVQRKFDFSKEKRKIIRTLDMLVIDEISMVRSDLLDAIDSVLRRYKHRDRAFGGVQLLMIGDLQQLTPVVTPADEEMLRPYYDTPYFFGSHALQQMSYVTIQLQKVYRQQDTKFVNILNHIREGKLITEDLDLLNSRYNPTFKPQKEEGYIRLTTHNTIANNYNTAELNRIDKDVFEYKATIKGTFPEYSYPTSEVLQFKVGAQVMFVKNDSSGERLYYNGKIGHITYLDKEHIEVLCPGDENSIMVEPQLWENTTYKINSETKEIEPDVQGSFCQFPLRLAWAITIHKSQGLTFEHTIIDANLSFASGQVYVALSRCKTLEGMVLASPISRQCIINDERVKNYIYGQEEEARRGIAQLPALKDDFVRQQLIELFDFMDIWRTEDMLCRLFIEYFHSYSNLTNLHKATVQALQEKVNIIAYKWTSYIAKLSVEQIKHPDFIKRISASAQYFSKMLKQYLLDVLQQSKVVKSNNKTAMRRLNTYITDLEEQYLSKKNILDYIIDNDYTVKGYQRAKQEAILDAMSQGSLKASYKTIEKKKKKKEPKENTKDITLRLLNCGLSVAEIAKQRELTENTIYTHISYFVEKGILSVSPFVNSEHLQAIRQAIEKVGYEQGFYPIKELCPIEITYEEIRLVVSAMKVSSNTDHNKVM